MRTSREIARPLDRSRKSLFRVLVQNELLNSASEIAREDQLALVEDYLLILTYYRGRQNNSSRRKPICLVNDEGFSSSHNRIEAQLRFLMHRYRQYE